MIILYWIALVLLAFFGFVNFFYLWIRDGKYPTGYFRETSINIDKFGNREFRALWNGALITSDSTHKFGNIEDTISGVLGHNYMTKTLTEYGKVTVFLLSPKHCLKAIGLGSPKEPFKVILLRVLGWLVFPLLYLFATPQSLRIAFNGVLMAIFGRWSNFNDSNVVFYIAISFVILFVIDLLWWIIKNITRQ